MQAVRKLQHCLEIHCDTLAWLCVVRQIHDWLEWPSKTAMADHLSAPSCQTATRLVTTSDIWAERSEEDDRRPWGRGTARAIHLTNQDRSQKPAQWVGGEPLGE